MVSKTEQYPDHFGISTVQCDYCLFINKSSTNITIVAIYVDDIIIMGSDPNEAAFVKAHLHSLFGIKDLGKLNFFLGLEVAYLKDCIFLSRHKFTQELLYQSGFIGSTAVVTPLPLNYKLTPDEGGLILVLSLYRARLGTQFPNKHQA